MHPLLILIQAQILSVLQMLAFLGEVQHNHTLLFALQLVAILSSSILITTIERELNIMRERLLVLQYPHPIRAVALKRLNCRVQNCARGSLRGRGLHPAYLIVHIKILPSEGTIF